MKLFGWLRKEKGNSALADWRNDWTAAIEQGEGDAALRDRLTALAAMETDVELELEMLDALDQLRNLQKTIATGHLPVVETQHRVIAPEACHYTAPASIATDHAQATGRLLLTASRAVFVGAGRTSVSAWHQVKEVVRIDRDVLFLRADRTPAAHYRFNSYGDAVIGAFLARRLKNPGRAPL